MRPDFLESVVGEIKLTSCQSVDTQTFRATRPEIWLSGWFPHFCRGNCQHQNGWESKFLCMERLKLNISNGKNLIQKVLSSWFHLLSTLGYQFLTTLSTRKLSQHRDYVYQVIGMGGQKTLKSKLYGAIACHDHGPVCASIRLFA